MGQRGSQWNGPSWPYQTSQALTAMANFLNNYHQHIVTNTDYLKILRQFTQQHYLPNGKINLVEDYDPNAGGPIVYYYWSNHYLHSSFNNLIITGSCGIRPSDSDTLYINPLIDSTIKYFCLDNVLYHGHIISIVYDRDGNKYKTGKGLTVFIDGKKTLLQYAGNKYKVFVGNAIIKNSPKQPVDIALNITHTGYPLPSASVNAEPDTSLYQAIDGRIWYFPEITNRWTTLGSASKTDWFALDFGKPGNISLLKLYLVVDSISFGTPDNITIEYQNKDEWVAIKTLKQLPLQLTGNSVNTFSFDTITTSRIRIRFTHAAKAVAVTEVECY